jgi:demethoxyubiquinone hydroxylase (CLK1/Coq7/Cat5 family)
VTAKEQKQTVEQLNSFLRGELSAVETYGQALGKLQDFPQRDTLEDCARSHQERVRLLQREILNRGGEPAQGSGAWGTLVNAIAGGASMIGPKAAIAALEEGEDHGWDDYQRDVEKLDSGARTVIESSVLPEQQRTHDAINSLKRALA